ncbi:MAG TPA: hypothetical protein VGL91_14580 [Acidobacteriota bacterium]|jgi:hypothetical protein
MGGFNYVEFIMEVNSDKQIISDDGRILFAKVLDMDEELLMHNRRMAFVKETLPESKARDLKKGDRLHVLGVPRIDLALVSWRVKNAKTKPDVLTWNLPYEIVVVAAYGN